MALEGPLLICPRWSFSYYTSQATAILPTWGLPYDTSHAPLLIYPQ